MGMRRLLYVAVSAVSLGGCVVATPFRGPGQDVTAGSSELVLSLTQATLNDDSRARAVFWDYVDRVETSLEDQPGFVGFSKRTELFGDNAWTMTVWSDAESLQAFVESEPHRAAMRNAMGALADARFVRVTIGRDELPVTWERALELLERQGRQYYE